MSAMMLVLGLLVAADCLQGETTYVASCGQQSKCLSWTVKALPASHQNCGGDCQFEVCATADLMQCKGSSSVGIDRACVVGQDVCGSDITSTFDDWGAVRISHQNRICQVGLGGTVLHFPMNDAAHCVGRTPPVDIADGSQVSCAPRMAYDPSCSSDVIDCIWKVTLPACRTGFPSETTLAGLVAGALLGSLALTRLALRCRNAAPSMASPDTTKSVPDVDRGRRQAAPSLPGPRPSIASDSDGTDETLTP